MSIFVEKAGMQTTVQDLGRFGFCKHGVQTSGAMDLQALKLANLMVSNPANTAGLEITLDGPILKFQAPAVIGIAGAKFEISIDGSVIPAMRPISVNRGSRLIFGRRVKGSRTYLVIKGGFELPKVFSSYSTNTVEKFGGLNGRCLKAGDVLKFKTVIPYVGDRSKTFTFPRWFLKDVFLDTLREEGVVRFIPCKLWETLEQSQRDGFLRARFKVGLQSNRMGYRLTGSKVKSLARDAVSKPIPFGAIQLLPSGDPVIIMADGQTMGGYPVLGVVISIDRSVLAQLAPGGDMGFEELSLDEAQGLIYERVIRDYQLVQAIGDTPKW